MQLTHAGSKGDDRVKAHTIILVLTLLATTLRIRCASPAHRFDPATQKLSHEIFKQLIEINTTGSVGSVTAAAEAMRTLLGAGFPVADLTLAGSNAASRIW
jgi:hypothetical protein